MYQLMVFHDCGRHYSPDQSAQTPDELVLRMKELDIQGFRWHLTKDGGIVPGFACRVHRGMLALVWAADVESKRAPDA